MAEDLAKLQIRIDSLEALTADKRLDGLEKQGRKTERATDGLTAAFKRFAGPAAAAALVVSSLTKLTNVTREFDILNAQLITATGNATRATDAFEAIQDFATRTPYDLGQVTTAFTKLQNLGLTPSQRALESYGDTASAMGKSLDQLIEAVADAATGEFERLKEFGIRASKQGEEVEFTFKGVKEKVAFEAGAIEEYLTRLGEVNFDGAMTRRMETLDGAMSNLGDEWNKLWLNISKRGAGDAITGGVREVISVLEELNGLVASGQLEGYIDGVTVKFDGFTSDVVEMLNDLSQFFFDNFGEYGPAAEKAVDHIGEAFRNMPENIRAIIQLMAVEVASLVDYGDEYGTAFGKVLGVRLAELVEKAKVYGKALRIAINPFEDGEINVDKEIAALEKLSSAMTGDIFSEAERNIASITDARRQSIIAILDEREATISEADAQFAAADKAREAFEAKRQARLTNKEDVLAIIAAEAEDEEAKIARVLAAEEKAAAKKRQLQSQQLGYAADIAGQLASIAQAGGKEQFENYKILASAQAGISAAMAVLNVLADPQIPTALKPIAIGTTSALAAVQIAQINEQEYAGAYDNGGFIPAGKYGMVGEVGPELVSGPANVTSRKDTAKLLEQAAAKEPAMTNYFSIGLGVQGAVRQELMSMMPMLQQMMLQSARNGQRRPAI